MAKTLIWKLEVESNGRVPIEVVDVSPSVAVGVGMCDDGSAGDEVSLSSDRGGPWRALGLGQIDRAEVG
jgi:hypothetical protein